MLRGKREPIRLNLGPHQPEQPQFRTHVRAHEAVISNEAWYCDGPPDLGKSFIAKKTDERQHTVTAILVRAAIRAAKASDGIRAEAIYRLVDKLEGCGPKRRCGSMACPRCARAFQKAKVAAEETVIQGIIKTSPGKQLVMVTIIPMTLRFPQGELTQLNIRKQNRWLKDQLRKAGFDRVMLGSADISWEKRGGEEYYQLHWHVGMWTMDRKRLKQRLRRIFSSKVERSRPIVLTKTYSLRFLGYMNKGVKLPKLLRGNRSSLPDLLLALDRTEPLDLMVLMGLRIEATATGLRLSPIIHPRRPNRRD